MLAAALQRVRVRCEEVDAVFGVHVGDSVQDELETEGITSMKEDARAY